MKTLLWDICAFAGLALVTVGGALTYGPLGWLIPGVVLLAVGVAGGWVFRGRREEQR